MAAVYFQKTNTTVHAQRLDTAVANMRTGIAAMRELYALMTSMKDGTDFSLIETNLGLAVNRGSTLYVVLGQALELLDAPDPNNATLPNKLTILLTRWN